MAKSKPPPKAAAHKPTNQRAFPFAHYTGVVGVHTSLLAFASLFLPQSTSYLELTTLVPGALVKTSLDHPQHLFLDPITANPTLTLLSLCAGSIVLQSWWGGWLRNWWIELTVEGSPDDDKRMSKSILLTRKSSSLAKAWATVLLASFLLHFIIVLFGAPIASFLPCTYLLSLLLGILCIFPTTYVLGFPSFADNTEALVRRLTWIRVFAEMAIRNPVERALLYSAVGSVLGCWTGAIPIALDWDRPWQAWPLTPAFGAIGGYIIGSIAALTVNATVFLAEQGRTTQ